jgi:hypothetical protein
MWGVLSDESNLLLILASAVILGSESLGTQGETDYMMIF